MNKKIREIVYQKYGGHCGYCGRELKTIRDMQVDHIEPKRRDLKFVTKGYTKKLVSIDKFLRVNAESMFVIMVFWIKKFVLFEIQWI